jgi:maltodextrin utilization protein YvdJ
MKQLTKTATEPKIETKMSCSSFLVTASTFPAISKPYFIALGLFGLTSVILLYCKNFGHLKIFGQFYFQTLFLSEIKIIQIFL